MCIEGRGRIDAINANPKSTDFDKGDTMFVPANIGKCYISGDATLLKIRC